MSKCISIIYASDTVIDIIQRYRDEHPSEWRDLGQRVNMARTTLHNYAEGNCGISWATWIKLADVIGLSDGERAVVFAKSCVPRKYQKFIGLVSLPGLD